MPANSSYTGDPSSVVTFKTASIKPGSPLNQGAILSPYHPLPRSFDNGSHGTYSSQLLLLYFRLLAVEAEGH